MNNVFVKPNGPVIVRDPVTRKPLAAGGEWKPKNQFWVRRITQGDVIDATAAQTAAQAAPAKPAAPSGTSPGPSSLRPERPSDEK
jgi:hypothetical protein